MMAFSLGVIQNNDLDGMKIQIKRISCFPYRASDNFVTARSCFCRFEKRGPVMKTIAFALVVMLMLTPVVLAEETFNPYTGEWEDGPGIDAYSSHENHWNDGQFQEEAWSDIAGNGWDEQQTEDEWSESHEDEWDGEQSDNGAYSDAQEEQQHQEPARNESWSPPAETQDGGPPPWVGIPPHNLPDRR
jgi:hypothetical protein